MAQNSKKSIEKLERHFLFYASHKEMSTQEVMVFVIFRIFFCIRYYIFPLVHKVYKLFSFSRKKEGTVRFLQKTALFYIF